MLFNKELENVETEEGETAILHCEISKPDAPVEWRKGGVVVQPSDKYEMKLRGSTAELIIHGVEPEDCGDYTCSTGYEITTCSVYVQGKVKRGGNALVLLPGFLIPKSLTVTGQSCLGCQQSVHFFPAFSEDTNTYLQAEVGPGFISSGSPKS